VGHHHTSLTREYSEDLASRHHNSPQTFGQTFGQRASTTLATAGTHGGHRIDHCQPGTDDLAGVGPPFRVGGTRAACEARLATLAALHCDPRLGGCIRQTVPGQLRLGAAVPRHGCSPLRTGSR